MEWKYIFRNSGERSCRKDLKEKKKYPGAVRGLQKERDSTPPLHRWLKWEEWEDKKKKTERENGDWQKTMEGNVHEASAHTQQDGKQVWDSLFKCWQGLCMGVWMCGSMSLFLLLWLPRSPAVKSGSPFSLVPSFHTLIPRPPKAHSFFFSFLYTHSSSPPSLLAQRWMALSFWWVTDEWSSSLKSRVTARPVKREEMPDKRWQRARGEREGREEKRGRGGGKRHMWGGNSEHHKVCKGRREHVCGRESTVCIFAWVPRTICIVMLKRPASRKWEIVQVVMKWHLSGLQGVSCTFNTSTLFHLLL